MGRYERIAEAVIAGALDKRLVRKISGMTDRNDHVGAIIELAKAMGERQDLAVARALETVADFTGYSSGSVLETENKLRSGLLAKAKRKMSPEEYRALYMAF